MGTIRELVEREDQAIAQEAAALDGRRLVAFGLRALANRYPDLRVDSSRRGRTLYYGACINPLVEDVTLWQGPEDDFDQPGPVYATPYLMHGNCRLHGDPVDFAITHYPPGRAFGVPIGATPVPNPNWMQEMQEAGLPRDVIHNVAMRLAAAAAVISDEVFPMTKAELLAELAPYPNDALIVFATDDEGTRCVPLAGDVSAGYWRVDAGEFDEEARWDDQQFRKRRNVVAALCLWPERDEVAL